MQRQAECAGVKVDGVFKIGHIDIDQELHGVFPSESFLWAGQKHITGATPGGGAACGQRSGLNKAAKQSG
jgi:hypothetical protein